MLDQFDRSRPARTVSSEPIWRSPTRVGQKTKPATVQVHEGNVINSYLGENNRTIHPRLQSDNMNDGGGKIK